MDVFSNPMGGELSFTICRHAAQGITSCAQWKATTSTSLLIGLRHFITPKLASLSISFLANDATSALPGVAAFLQPNPPSLNNLEIILCFKADSVSRSFFDAAHDIGCIIQLFPDISSLRTDGWILVYGCRPFILLKNLEKNFLDVEVDWEDTPGYIDSLPLARMEVFLPRLAHVRSHDLVWDDVSSLFLNTADNILSFTLSQPEVMDRWFHTPLQLIGSFTAMGDHCVNLTSLGLQDVVICEKDADLTGSLLPFLQCKNMEEFDIFAVADFSRFISDDDVAQMAAAQEIRHSVQRL
jgi:hypothetical protein